MKSLKAEFQKIVPYHCHSHIFNFSYLENVPIYLISRSIFDLNWWKSSVSTHFSHFNKISFFFQDVNAPFPYAFEQIGWITIKWIVNIGAVFALFTSLLGAMFPLPRVLYAMGSDGVIFKFLAKIHPKTMTPVLGTIVSGLLTGENYLQILI